MIKFFGIGKEFNSMQDKTQAAVPLTKWAAQLLGFYLAHRVTYYLLAYLLPINTLLGDASTTAQRIL
jgi:hypothetical protein